MDYSINHFEKTKQNKTKTKNNKERERGGEGERARERETSKTSSVHLSVIILSVYVYTINPSYIINYRNKTTLKNKNKTKQANKQIIFVTYFCNNVVCVCIFQKNNTLSLEYEIYSGEKDVMKLANTKSYNGSEQLHWWHSKEANAINGSGEIGASILEIYHPHVEDYANYTVT